MKIQDLGFFVLLGILLWRRDARWLVYAGLGFLVVSMPLFSLWIFFTAQRFVQYGALCFFLAVGMGSVQRKGYA